MDQATVSEQYYVYLACCANGTLYVGSTRNVEQRMATHNAGWGGRYTRSNRPVSLVAAWPFNSRAEALRAERALKRLPPARKLAMAESITPPLGEEA
jgi:putative endonuclease